MKYSKGLYIRTRPDFNRKLKEAAERAKEPVSTYIREAIRQRLDRQGKVDLRGVL